MMGVLAVMLGHSPIAHALAKTMPPPLQGDGRGRGRGKGEGDHRGSDGEEGPLLMHMAVMTGIHPKRSTHVVSDVVMVGEIEPQRYGEEHGHQSYGDGNMDHTIWGSK